MNYFRSSLSSLLVVFLACLIFLAGSTCTCSIAYGQAEPQGKVDGKAGWKAGTARVNITPQHSMWMSGYGSRNKPSEGKLTDLWARALVLEDRQGKRGVLVSLDLVGIDRALSQRVCKRVERQYQLNRDQIALATSHTHTGPVVGMNLGPLHYLQVDRQQQKRIDAYAEKLEEQLVELVGKALQDLEPVTIHSGSGKATFAVNRRNNRPASDVPQLREQGKLAGPTDHDVPVLAVRQGSKLKAVAFGYACHATVLSFNQWSGDYPGFAQLALEQQYPDCTALFWAGCGADQNPLPRRTVELAKEYGQRLADAVQRTLDSSMHRLTANLEMSYREIPLPLDELPTRADLEKQAESTNRYEQARAKMLLAKIDSGEPLSQTYPYPVQAWTLGGKVDWVFLGGEVVVDYALRLKAEANETSTWVAGYANDVMAYIPSRRVLREGGYEGGGAMVYYGLPTVWAPAVENDIVQEAHRQMESHR